MKTLFKRFAGILLAAILAIMPATMAATAKGQTGPNTYSYIGLTSSGAYIYHSSQTTSVTGMTYDKSTNTLTLNGYNNEAEQLEIYSMGDDFRINLNGTNSIGQITVWEGALTICGNGTLSVNSSQLYGASEDGSPLPSIFLSTENEAFDSSFTLMDSAVLKLTSPEQTSSLIYIYNTVVSDAQTALDIGVSADELTVFADDDNSGVYSCELEGTYRILQKPASSDDASQTPAKESKTKVVFKNTSKTFKASALKKAKKTYSIIKKTGGGKVTYTVTKGKEKYIAVSKKGIVTVKKGAKAGTYKVKVAVAAKNNYSKAIKTIKIKVKK